MTSRLAVRTCAALAALLGSQRSLDAQTVYASSGPPAAVMEFTGPPAGACAYPNGPLVGGFPTAAPFVCPLPGPVLAPLLGDIAVDRMTDTVWVTDGFVVGGYTPAGVPLSGFPLPPGAVLPGPLTGMGFGAGILWITDGAFIAGIFPPPAPGCPGPPPPIAVPPWPVPPGLAIVTDVDWDPATGSLWACTAGGLVANLFVGGGVGLVMPAAACALGLPLTGIACDRATPTFFGGPACLYVSDGFVTAYMAPPAVAGPVTFYTTAPCFPNPAAPSTGLSSSLHAITYGAGFDPLGPPFPVMGSFGQSTTPSATFGITLAGASPIPGTITALFVDFGALCPPLAFKGNPLYALPTLFVGPFPVAGGALVLPAALPPALPIGLPIFCQWIVSIGGGGGAFQVSSGLEFTIGMP